ncbi:MAG: hypothetical protein P8Y23_18090, partial [Candidatus Lokiarchaeota archaeon]
MAKLDIKRYFHEFVRYNKSRIFKIILYGIIILYLSFLICYNTYRNNLSYLPEAIIVNLSWLYGFLTALIITIIIVLCGDMLSFYLKIRRTPIELLE